MELMYEFDANQNITNAHFDGLDGCESVSSIKEALNLMQIVNPAVGFANAVKAGMYLDVSDEVYQRMLDSIKHISTLWRYPDDPADSQTRYQLSALMLLANAIEVISEQDKTEGTVQVNDTKGKSLKVRENLGLFSGYSIATQAASYGWVNLDDTKLAKLDERSEADIQKDGKLLELHVRSGNLFFNITEPLADDETLNIRTSSMVIR